MKLPGDYYNIWYFELTTLHNQSIQLLGNIELSKLVIMVEARKNGHSFILVVLNCYGVILRK